jgi:hypothetical protein
VATVHVALCDNEHQGIVRVPAALGNGDDPQGNLYWGAMYGARTFLSRQAGWKLLVERDSTGDVLKEAVFSYRAAADPKWGELAAHQVEVLLVARAWRGSAMRQCLAAFARDLLADEGTTVRLPDGRAVAAGGAGHVVGFVGHNGLMDLARGEWPFAAVERAGGSGAAAGEAATSPSGAAAGEAASTARPDATRRPPKAWFVLACKSDPYFAPELQRSHAVRLLTTRQFMAPEAYTLAALVEAMACRADAPALRAAAVAAYARYQRLSPRAAAGIFAN